MKEMMVLALALASWAMLRSWPGLAFAAGTPSTGARQARGIRAAARSQRPPRWPAAGDFPFDLVIDGRQPQALSYLLSLGTGSAACYRTAWLRPQGNKRGVSVCIAGRQVGQLADDDASAYLRRLEELGPDTGDIGCDCVLRILRREEGLCATIQLDPDLRGRPFEAATARPRAA